MAGEAMTARAFWTAAPGRGELRAEALPAPGAGERRFTMIASGISRGTEALVFRGGVPESQFQAMRAPLMGGAFPFPVKYGYCAVARAEDGARFFILHPHQDVFNAPAALAVPVPDDVPSRRAVLAANMETALNLLWDAGPLPGMRALVIGAGVLGLLTAALLARIPGVSVTVCDLDPARAAPATALGCRFARPEAAPSDQDLVFHTSASEAGLALALRAAADEAAIIEASWYGRDAPAVPLGEDFHARRLRLIASQVGRVAPAMRGRRTSGERLALALDLLRDPVFDSLLAPPTPFAALPEAMPRLLAGGLCHVIDYGVPDV